MEKVQLITLQQEQWYCKHINTICLGVFILIHNVVGMVNNITACITNIQIKKKHVSKALIDNLSSGALDSPHISGFVCPNTSRLIRHYMLTETNTVVNIISDYIKKVYFIIFMICWLCEAWKRKAHCFVQLIPITAVWTQKLL